LQDPFGCIALHPKPGLCVQSRLAVTTPAQREEGKKNHAREEDLFLGNPGRKSTEEEVTSCPPETDDFLLAG
jgi:hypothetical protein